LVHNKITSAAKIKKVIGDTPSDLLLKDVIGMILPERNHHFSVVHPVAPSLHPLIYYDSQWSTIDIKLFINAKQIV
jgi:hypothetical protein